MNDLNAGPTDEMLMAYADGEASPQDAAVVEAAVAADPAVAERLALFEGTREVAREAMPLEPVPDALRASIEAMVAASASAPAPEGVSSPASNDAAPPPSPEGENVLAFRPRGSGGRFPRRQLFTAMAASVLGVAIGVGGFFAGAQYGGTGGGAPSPGAGGIAQLASLPLQEGLSLPSGAEMEAGEEGVIRTIATFRSGTGELCREFEVEGDANVVGVACRRDGDWSVEFAVATLPDPTGYVPASGFEALDAYLASIAAEPPLSAEEEAEALETAR